MLLTTLRFTWDTRRAHGEAGEDLSQARWFVTVTSGEAGEVAGLVIVGALLK